MSTDDQNQVTVRKSKKSKSKKSKSKKWKLSLTPKSAIESEDLNPNDEAGGLNPNDEAEEVDSKSESISASVNVNEDRTRKSKKSKSKKSKPKSAMSAEDLNPSDETGELNPKVDAGDVEVKKDRNQDSAQKLKNSKSEAVVRSIHVNDLRRDMDIYTNLEVKVGELYKIKADNMRDRIQCETRIKKLTKAGIKVNRDRELSEIDKNTRLGELDKNIKEATAFLGSQTLVDEDLEKVNGELSARKKAMESKMKAIVTSFCKKNELPIPILARFFTDVKVAKKISEWVESKVVVVVAGSVTKNDAKPIEWTVSDLGVQCWTN